MRILVTGDNGYLGSEFIKRHGSEFDVVGYDRKDGFDLLDHRVLEERMTGCQQVVHLAAIPKPIEGKDFPEYFKSNVEGTLNVFQAALKAGAKRVIYASSTTIYGIERGIPFQTPITESQSFVSQYLKANQLSTRDVDLSYHMSKVMAEQIVAWFGLNKKLETIALRFGPINKVFLGTSVSIENASQAIKLALDSKNEFWYEAFSIVDDVPHIDISKARKMLGYNPAPVNYSPEQIRSTLADRSR